MITSPDKFRFSACFFQQRLAQFIFALITFTMVACSTTMPSSYTVREGLDPENRDESVRFRSSYYFRVYDFCRNPEADGVENKILTDSLYRYRMTGKTNALFSKIHFESGVLNKNQIDPFGSHVKFDQDTNQFHYISAHESQKLRKRKAIQKEIQGIFKQLKESNIKSSELDQKKQDFLKNQLDILIASLNQIEGIPPESSPKAGINAKLMNEPKVDVPKDTKLLLGEYSEVKLQSKTTVDLQSGTLLKVPTLKEVEVQKGFTAYYKEDGQMKPVTLLSAFSEPVRIIGSDNSAELVLESGQASIDKDKTGKALRKLNTTLNEAREGIYLKGNRLEGPDDLTFKISINEAGLFQFKKSDLTVARSDDKKFVVTLDKQKVKLNEDLAGKIAGNSTKMFSTNDLIFITGKAELTTVDDVELSGPSNKTLAVTTPKELKTVTEKNHNLYLNGSDKSTANLKIASGEKIKVKEVTMGPEAEKTCKDGTPAQRGFQILGPEGFRTFNQNERLVLAMSSSAKPLVNSLKELSDRVLKSRSSPEKSLLPLVNELLKVSQAQNAMQNRVGEMTSIDGELKNASQIVEIAEKALRACEKIPSPS